MACWTTYWRIATSLAGLTKGHLFARGLPPPDTTRYLDYSEKLLLGQGGKDKQGFINLTLQWDDLDFLQGKVLRALVDAGTTLYLTVDRSDGTGLLNDFIDISGRPDLSDLVPTRKSRGIIYPGVELFVNNITVENDPSNIF